MTPRVEEDVVSINIPQKKVDDVDKDDNNKKIRIETKIAYIVLASCTSSYR